MRAGSLVAAMLLYLGFAALTCAAAPAAVSDPDAQVIRQRMAQWVDGYNQADVPAIMEVLSTDYVQDTQGLPGSVDRRQMERSFNQVFAKYRTHIVCVLDQVYTAGDMGFDRGHYYISYTPKDGGATVTESGRYMEVWGLQDGVWRVRYVTNIPEPPAAPVAVM